MGNIITHLNNVGEPLGTVGSPSNPFDVTIDIREKSESSKLLGELVCFTVQEDKNKVLALGQITEIETKNRWHEEPSFKGIIKRHGELPNLSGVADNRIAKINVQSSFIVDGNKAKAHKLANSPSTGEPVNKVNDDIMGELVKEHEGLLVCLGKAYDTEVRVPFWFKHFGSPEKGGDGDTYHIGIFGRTGSGKTTVAANMILGYARNSEDMSILILDPQEQFYKDNNVLPYGKKFETEVKAAGMNFSKYRVPEEIALPNDPQLFSELLLQYGFIRKAFNIHTQDKQELMAESIQEYVIGRMNDQNFKVGSNPEGLLSEMIKRFVSEKDDKYLSNVYSSGHSLNRIEARLKRIQGNLEGMDQDARKIWNYVCNLFNESNKKKFEAIVEEVALNPGNVIVLNISGRKAVGGMESIQTLFVKIIEDALKEKGEELYAEGEQANCLVVLDEAHRFISTYNYDEGIKQLTTSIIDAVRTTRKFGIGYMFITQTIDSLHEEIRRQIRISAFGYGLTSGSEFSKIKEIINDPAAAKFYRSFIDPSSNQKYPFMFHGPISPLSVTGAPLFLEMGGLISDFP